MYVTIKWVQVAINLQIDLKRFMNKVFLLLTYFQEIILVCNNHYIKKCEVQMELERECNLCISAKNRVHMKMLNSLFWWSASFRTLRTKQCTLNIFQNCPIWLTCCWKVEMELKLKLLEVCRKSACHKPDWRDNIKYSNIIITGYCCYCECTIFREIIVKQYRKWASGNTLELT